MTPGGGRKHAPPEPWHSRRALIKTRPLYVGSELPAVVYPQIAAILNDRGLRSGEGKAFSVRIVARIQKEYGLTSRYDRLRKAGMLTVQEMAAQLGVTPQCVKIWNRHGVIRGHAYNDKNDCLYEHPGANPPRKAQGVKLSRRRLTSKVAPARTQEVQCEA